MNIPKSDFASEELARNKLARDLAKAYDAFARAKPDIEFRPQILLELLSLLGIFKELKLASDVALEQETEAVAKDLGMSVGSGPQEESKPVFHGVGLVSARKENEQNCMKKMWKILSFGGREVGKDILTGTVYTMLLFEDSQSMETKEGLVREAAKIENPSDEMGKDMRTMVELFDGLAREAKETRYITYFVTKLRTLDNPREENEAKECSFVPKINKKSRKLDVEKTKEKEKQRAKEAEKRGADDSQKAGDKDKGKFKAKRRSQSPARHDILYENYKEIMDKLQKEQEKSKAEESKLLTFKPKVSKAANKIHEGSNERVPPNPR